ncbi:MAG: hypothetical protein ACRD2X_22220 [Vicinamibacteraceae bacterium]
MKAMDNPRRHIMKRFGTALAVTVAMSIALATPTTVAGQDQEANAQKRPTAADVIDTAQALEQARVAGLTDEEAVELQAKVEKEIALTDGIQVAANEVLWGDGAGATTIPLPGERYARRLGSPQPQQYARCDPEEFCTFEGSVYRGKMRRYWKCDVHPTLYYFYSWVNNQVPQGSARTVATFYGADISRNTPPAYSRNPNTTVGDWSLWLRNCR